MKNKSLHIILLLFMVLPSHNQGLLAQDIHFSQFFETPLLRNPALAGIFSGDSRMQAVYRNQWQSVTTPYQTVSFNAEWKRPVGKQDDFITIGGEILYDKAGSIALNATHLLPALNYHKSLGAEQNMYLSLGFMAGYVQRRFDADKVITNSQFDGTVFNSALSNGEQFSTTSYGYFDASVGMSFNAQLGNNPDNNFFAGVAYQHLNRPSGISFFSNPELEIPAKFVVSAGLRMNATDHSFLTFQGDFSKQRTYTETVAGFLYSIKLDDWEDPTLLLHGGVFFRVRDAVIPVVKIEKRPLSFAISYDINTSQLTPASQSRGGLEFSLTYQKFITKDSRYTSREAVRCPRF